jgi:divinyl protochlorophyllide a 8-vinyl-reductase
MSQRIGELVLEKPPGVVGPNAVIQLARALKEGPGPEAAQDIFAAAGCQDLLAHPPSEMVDERIPAQLCETLWQKLPDAIARRVAEDAGRRTGRYILENRIPSLVQKILRRLPPPIALRLLTIAIGRNAWTFAGSGPCRVRPRNPAVIEIARNPVRMPDCIWHQAVFAELFGELVAGDVLVRHPQCCRSGSNVCRFEVVLGTARTEVARAQLAGPANGM